MVSNVEYMAYTNRHGGNIYALFFTEQQMNTVHEQGKQLTADG